MKKVFLSAGHGGSDPGAVGFGINEKDINLSVMLECKAELERHGVSVVCSRYKDENDPVTEEVKEANASGANVAVSFHANAGHGDGSETYYFEGDANGKRLAELCERNTQRIGQNSRGVKSGNHLWFIRKTNMTAVLCETAFVDTKADLEQIDRGPEQKAFGVAYAHAIMEFLGISINSEVSFNADKDNVVQSSSKSNVFKVSVNISNLRIRSGAGTNTNPTGKYTGIGVFTITEVKEGPGSKSGWGKLASGAGWISLDFTTKI